MKSCEKNWNRTISRSNFLRSLDPKKTIVGYAESMNQQAVEIFHQLGLCSVCTSPVTPVPALRAIKDEREIAGFRRAMQLDGVAMVRFRRALDEIIEKGEIGQETELSIEQRLTAFRAEHPDFRGLSFGTIAGYGAHGAIVHYEADEESNATLAPRSFLLLDSGAHYVSGTTDITRTIPLGSLTDEERKAYTLVLKGRFGARPLPGAHTRLGARFCRPLCHVARGYGFRTRHRTRCRLPPLRA